MGSTPKNPGGIMMFRLVAAAKAEFAELFAAAEAGKHAALAPVNTDVQARQIAAAYIEDTEEVAVAKVAFLAAFEEAKSGGLSAKQAPAPVHVVSDPLVPSYLNYPLSYHSLSYSPYSYTPHHLPYYAAHLSIPAFGLHGLPYNGLPYSGVPAYSSLPT